MSRCRCCEAILTVHDLTLKQEDDSFEDLCGTCRWFAYNDEYIETRTYAFQDITECMVSTEIYDENKDIY